MGNCCFKKACQSDMERESSQMGKCSATVEYSPMNNDEAVNVEFNPEENLAPGAKIPMPREKHLHNMTVPVRAQVLLNIIRLEGFSF